MGKRFWRKQEDEKNEGVEVEKGKGALARATRQRLSMFFREKKTTSLLACEQLAPQNHGAPPSTSSLSTVTPVASSRQETCVPESWNRDRGKRERERNEK